MNNDLISRKALLEGFDVHKVTEYDESGCGVDYKAVPVDVIMKAPAVDAEPVRHGRWIPMELNRSIGMFVGVGCSLCSFEKIGSAYKYCPSCGAKMDGGG